MWGYKGQYPVAEIKNADYNTVTTAMSAAGTSHIELLNLTNSSTLKSKLDGVRNQLSSALLTQYTYYPLIGTASVTTPANLSTYYEYDAFGRLARIRNHKSQIVKEYAYGYSGSTAGTGGNQAPTSYATLPNQTAIINQPFTFTLPANLIIDPEGQTLTYSMNGLPVGLSFSNGVISGTPSSLGTSLITLVATDPGGLSGNINFSLTVSSCFSADPYIVTGTFTSPTPVVISAASNIETDAAQAVSVNATASLTLKAVVAVRLKPGFTVKPGAAFRAYNAPCN